MFSFLTYDFGVLTDLKSAYQSIKCHPETCSLRRYFWYRDINDTTSLQECCFTAVQYGDAQATPILTMSMTRILPKRAKTEKVKNFLMFRNFVDDGWEPFKNPFNYPNFKFDLQQTMKYHNFKIKKYLVTKNMREILNIEIEDDINYKK